ncbi:GNAT family N-acetyltransferase [Clostridium tertium]
MEIISIDKNKYKGYKFTAKYVTDKYYDVICSESGFNLELKMFENSKTKKQFKDELFSEWLEDPIVFGIIENDILVAFIEGSTEEWHKLFRISNIFVSENFRRRGMADRLIEKMIEYAKILNNCRGIILETQTCNYPAIQLYKKHGFKLSRIDINEYTNNDIENRKVRIDLLLKI